MPGQRRSRTTKPGKKDRGQTLDIQGRAVTVTNLDKVFFPAAGFTKGQMIDYYIRASRFMLPHLKDRPITLKRYPDGIAGEFFYEKDAPGYTPEWVARFPVPRRAGGADICYILINDLATLVWCANIATIEFHTFLHRAPGIGTPTEVVFDLDPGEGSTVLKCIEVGFILRELLDELGLKSFPKMSGSKGIQVYVPLNTPATYDVTQTFARTIAQLLERQHYGLIVSEMAKIARKQKVFIDWSQNADFKTTVCVYSMRAKRQTPFISVPVTWDELDRALTENDTSSLYFQPEAALERLEKTGDLFAPVLTLKQKLPEDFVHLLQGRIAKQKAPSALREYERKRDFSKTREPGPTAPRRSHQGGRRRFVIQKHAASHLHYDFRLEMHGVLKSWAVPKGLPYSPGEKRLAMETEDHPIDYLEFEGTIPKGQYGGGTVMVWDIGSYEIIDGNYYKGRLHLFFAGKKLKGEWMLIRNPAKGDRNWIVTKAGAAIKSLTANKENTSAISGRTMEQIAEANDAQWHSNRAPAGITIDLDALPKADMEFIEPMQALLVSELPERDGWDYEIKLDGYRALAIRNGSRVRLLSRRNNDFGDKFSEITKACLSLDAGMIVDGEIVALDERGRPSFNLLQNYQSTRQPIVYYIFDLLAYRNRSLLHQPLAQRRELLSAALAGIADPIRLLGALDASAQDLIAAAKEQGIEGFVAKRRNSIYEPGARTEAWVKFKVNKSQEFVIGGYKPGKDGFESLLAGYYDRNKLIFVGKVKNGFVPRAKQEIMARLQGLETDECPFANLPEPKGARRGEALTAAVMKNYRWVEPQLVMEVEYTDWTEANHLRHSRFAGLREDKSAREVVKERPVKPE